MEDVSALEDHVVASFAQTDGAVGVADPTRGCVLVEIDFGVDERDGLAALTRCWAAVHHNELHHQSNHPQQN